jgi:hypothetical protein
LNFDDGSQSRIPIALGRRGLAEKNFGDEILANWRGDESLPPDAVVTHVLLIPYRGERCVLAWKDGVASLPEGEVAPAESADLAIRRIAAEQAGIVDLRATHLGHWLCKATIYAKSQSPGTVTYRAVYGIEVDALSDFPSGVGYERRIVAQRDMVANIRSRHVESKVELMEALDRFIVARQRAREAETTT